MDAAVARVGHAVPELAGDPAARLVDDVPLDGVVVERAHRLLREGLAVPAADRLAPADAQPAGHRHHGVLGVEVGELVPVAGGAAAPRDLLVVQPLALDLVPGPGRHRSLLLAGAAPARAALAARGQRDHLGLEVLLEALLAVLTPEPALAVAAEGRVDVEPHAAVHRQRAGADAARDRERALLGGAVHGAREAVDRVVRDAHGVVIVLVGDHAEHGPEDPLLPAR